MIASTSRCFAAPRGATARPQIAARAPAAARLAAPGRARAVSVSAKSSAAPAAVRVTIQGRRLPVTDAIKDYVESKIEKAVSHFARNLKSIDVTLSARGGDTGTHGKKEQRVEVTIHTLRNGVVRVEDAEDSLYAAIDLVCDKAERKLVRAKERAQAKGRWHSHGGAQVEDNEAKAYMDELRYETSKMDKEVAIEEQFAELNSKYPATVRRTKVVELDLMTVDEAIDAMEAVGHDFFVYLDTETNALQILYRRGAGGVGILKPVNRA